VIVIIVFVGAIIGYLYPGILVPGKTIAIQISFVILFGVLLATFLSYPEIKRFVVRRKMKNK
jgi:hypothetical protein